MDKLTNEALENNCNDFLNVDNMKYDSLNSNMNMLLESFVLDNAKMENGRIILPALFNEKLIERLPNNYGLAKSILNSVYNKLKGDPMKLEQYDEIFKQQREAGIISMESELNNLIDNEDFSFLAHNAVYKQESLSTKCRIVYLSNLCQKGDNTLSHNQVSMPGPQRNPKIVTALNLLRFNKYLLIMDLKKAFLQICLRKHDTDKLMFLWFKDISRGDFSIVAYRINRVPFGMRYSPFLLFIALRIILILHASCLSQLEQDIHDNIYNSAYMDNLSYSSDDHDDLCYSYDYSIGLFERFGFGLQQFNTNNKELNSKISDESSPCDQTKLLGLNWDVNNDSLSCKKFFLNPDASTKREILSTLNSNYDPLGLALPIFNRAKLFLHSLQIKPEIEWDIKLNSEYLGEWRKIAKQINNSNPISIARSMGSNKDNYNLVACTDSSKDFYGCVLYLQSSDGNISFLYARNKTINKQLSKKTIPVLELIALKFGVQCLIDAKHEFDKAHLPINIIKLNVCTDSTIALNWLQLKTQTFSKVEKKSIIVNNCLDEIVDISGKFPIHFFHIEGLKNPADHVTRLVSERCLTCTNYHSGPKMYENSILTFRVPKFEYNETCIMSTEVSLQNDPILPIEKVSDFYKLCRISMYVHKFVYNLKVKIGLDRCIKPKFHDARIFVVREAQKMSYPQLFDYFYNPSVSKELPIISQLNLFLDSNGLIRVKCKFEKLNAIYSEKYPILLHKSSVLTKNIILSLHLTLRHAGTYKLLNIIRKEFWIPSAFQTIKRVLKSCLICRKTYGRSLPINQNAYPDFRINPVELPFRQIGLDHIGPFTVKDFHGVNKKVYILIITCLWSRAVHLIMSNNLNNEEFLMGLQLHVFEYGIPELIISDNGSPIVSSIPQIKSYLDDPTVKDFLDCKNIKIMEFRPYPSNASFLGGFIESLVKQVKNIIYSSLSKTILDYPNFSFLVRESNMLINKRPIAYKNILTNPDSDPSVIVITPEMLLKGYDVPSIAIIPQLTEGSDDESYNPNVNPTNERVYSYFRKLNKVKAKLNSLYYDEFISNLRSLSCDRPQRYKRRSTVNIRIGDFVAIKSKFSKPYFYPNGIVTDLKFNDLNEAVAIYIRLSNREIICRHPSDVILLENLENISVEVSESSSAERQSSRSRNAAEVSRIKTKDV